MRIHWNWGTGIALTYTAFALATASMVALAISQPPELVSADYYEQSLRYDRRIEGTQNAEALGTTLSIVVNADGRIITMQLPPERRAGANGTVTLYRPSNSHADRVVPLGLDVDGSQRLSLADAQSGAWRLKVEWTSSSRPYTTSVT